MSVYEIRDFIFKNYHKQIGYSTEKSYYSMKRLKRKYLLLLANKLIEKISDLVMLKNIIKHFEERNTENQ